MVNIFGFFISVSTKKFIFLYLNKLKTIQPKTKRLTKIIHPNSRRALDLASKEYHKSKAIRSKEDFKQKTNVLARKLTWFKSLISNEADARKGDEEGGEQQMSVDEKISNDHVDDEHGSFKTNPFFTLPDIHKIIEL